MSGEIVERLEAATGPDRELDAAIYDALVDDGGRFAFRVTNWATNLGNRLGRYHDGWCVGKSPTDEYAENLPRFTESLDAVLALVGAKLPGWNWATHTTGGGSYEACLMTPDYHELSGRAFECMAKTPAIAILLALFRALESSNAK